MKAIIILAAAVALTGCMKNPEHSPREEAALMKTSRDWSKAAEARDLDAVASYFADNALMISAGQQPLRGKETIRASLRDAFKTPGFSISWEPLEAHVTGNMGYLVERTRMTMNGPEGQPVTETLQAVTIWRKGDDGKWKNLVDVSVPAPVTPAAPAT